MADLYRNLQARKIKPIDLADAKQQWLDYRLDHGYKSYAKLLTPPENNSKLAKSKKDADIYGLSLAPADASGTTVCRYSTPNCRAGCVAYAGQGEMDSVLEARVVRTRFLEANPSAFITILKDEIKDKTTVRLNTFSDLPWENIDPTIFSENKKVQFYDYTKWPERNPPKNYHITYSASEKTTDAEIIDRCSVGQNVAVLFDVVRGHPLPAKYLGIKVIDGDETDARYLDKKGIIVGLRAKGRMRTGKWDMVRKVGLEKEIRRASNSRKNLVQSVSSKSR